MTSICLTFHRNFIIIITVTIIFYRQINKLRLKNINRFVISHLNINSLPNKFDRLKIIIKNEVDILVITEIKLDSSFLDLQF